jgi:hypothetical protein
LAGGVVSLTESTCAEFATKRYHQADDLGRSCRDYSRLLLAETDSVKDLYGIDGVAYQLGDPAHLVAI